MSVYEIILPGVKTSTDVEAVHASWESGAVVLKDGTSSVVAVIVAVPGLIVREKPIVQEVQDHGVPG
jgi:hypothetical protein